MRQGGGFNLNGQVATSKPLVLAPLTNLQREKLVIPIFHRIFANDVLLIHRTPRTSTCQIKVRQTPKFFGMMEVHFSILKYQTLNRPSCFTIPLIFLLPPPYNNRVVQRKIPKPFDNTINKVCRHPQPTPYTQYQQGCSTK